MFRQFLARWGNSLSLLLVLGLGLYTATTLPVGPKLVVDLGGVALLGFGLWQVNHQSVAEKRSLK